ncbi:RNA polymerase sigma factor [Planctomycetes bacterium Poly30]|uniref:RNA polymerase sigma factor n=1 Tax=Saltatorellus ferox TaxID=2528018 RepID=A0A518EYU3_9BACT|nr:RNA polymerase sigma factor [Planctomycetes bacterium Poly30]
MPDVSNEDFTLIPFSGSDGESHLTYGTIRDIAARIWRSAGRAPYVDATDLANECFLRLARRAPPLEAGRSVQVSYCVTIIRRLLVDEVRRRAAEPGIGRPTVILTSTEARETRPVIVDLLALDEALAELAEIDERQSRIVELRFFGGMDRASAAKVLDISVRTLTREWGLARAWLLARLRS